MTTPIEFPSSIASIGRVIEKPVAIIPIFGLVSAVAELIFGYNLKPILFIIYVSFAAFHRFYAFWKHQEMQDQWVRAQTIRLVGELEMTNSPNPAA